MTPTKQRNRLLALAEFHEQKAAICRQALALLDDAPVPARRVAKTLGVAARLDQARRSPGRPRGKSEQTEARRARTQQILGHFDREAPRPKPDDLHGLAIAQLVRFGYLRATKGGYVRTAKELA